MPEEHLNDALERLTEATAEQIIFTLQPGAIAGDPKPELIRRNLSIAYRQEVGLLKRLRIKNESHP